MHSALDSLTADVLNEILHDGQIFAPESFEENFSKWPEVIKSKWTYIPITMEINDIIEIIGYSIMPIPTSIVLTDVSAVKIVPYQKEESKN